MIAPLVSAFREGLQRGELLLQKCDSCGALNMYPRYACPQCQSESLAWHKASGHGVLHSFTVLRAGAPEGFESELPYALGVVKLTEGVQLLGRLIPDADGQWTSYRCEQKMQFAVPPAGPAQHRPCAWFQHARET
jgi:uncharacterized OB-fold protein